MGVIYSYKRQLSNQANGIIQRLLQPVAIPLKEVRKHIAVLCQQAASDIKTKISQQCSIDKIQSAKILISVKEKSKVWKEETCTIKVSSNLSAKIDEICTHFSENIDSQLEGKSLSYLSISWDIYLKDKDKKFHRIYDYKVHDSLAWRRIHRSSAYEISAEGINSEGRQVVNDQMEFI